jgi:hypothetical protein
MVWNKILIPYYTWRIVWYGMESKKLIPYMTLVWNQYGIGLLGKEISK